MIYTLALRYARSVLALAKEKNSLDDYQDQLKKIEKIFAASEDLIFALNNSQVSIVQKLLVVKKIFENKEFAKDIYNFIRLLIVKRKFFIFKEVLILFETLYLKEKNSLIVQVTTSEGITVYEKERIKNSLQNSFDCNIKMQEKIDGNILGGVIVQTGSYLIDGSVKNFLTKIRNNI